MVKWSIYFFEDCYKKKKSPNDSGQSAEGSSTLKENGNTKEHEKHLLLLEDNFTVLKVSMNLVNMKLSDEIASSDKEVL